MPADLLTGLQINAGASSRKLQLPYPVVFLGWISNGQKRQGRITGKSMRTQESTCGGGISETVSTDVGVTTFPPPEPPAPWNPKRIGQSESRAELGSALLGGPVTNNTMTYCSCLLLSSLYALYYNVPPPPKKRQSTCPL